MRSAIIAVAATLTRVAPPAVLDLRVAIAAVSLRSVRRRSNNEEKFRVTCSFGYEDDLSAPPFAPSAATSSSS